MSADNDNKSLVVSSEPSEPSEQLIAAALRDAINDIQSESSTSSTKTESAETQHVMRESVRGMLMMHDDLAKQAATAVEDRMRSGRRRATRRNFLIIVRLALLGFVISIALTHRLPPVLSVVLALTALVLVAYPVLFEVLFFGAIFLVTLFDSVLGSSTLSSSLRLARKAFPTLDIGQSVLARRVSAKRRIEIERAYSNNVRAGAPPYGDVTIESVDELVWILEERGWVSGDYERRADLRGVILTGASLNKARLTFADLRDAVLTSVNLCAAQLMGAQMQRANMHLAIVAEADFTGADMSHAKLTEIDATRAKFNGATMRAANMTSSVLNRAYFVASDLSGATLTDADLMGANLARATLTRSVMKTVNLSKANLVDALGMEVDLTEANLTGANLTRANFRGANLSRAILRGAVLNGVDLTNARLDGVRLDEAARISITNSLPDSHVEDITDQIGDDTNDQ